MECYFVCPSFVYAGASTPRVASEGFDLYIRKDGEWLYAASRAPKKRGEAYTMISRMDSSEKECLLYLPNYSELTSLRVGVDEGATITPMENPFRHKIVIFGSSFTHGVSTSRAGMSYPMQIGRNTGLYFCSIACSGNCKLQPYFADYLGDVKDADAMVFDAFSNPDAKMIEERLIPFIERIRAKLPSTPLIFVQTIYREHNPTGAPRGHVQHGHEHGEEHQRRAQIMLHDQHAHRHDPHHDDRPKILDARQLQAQHLLATDRQLVAVVIQVGGEEKREEQLRELAWLERSQTGNLHPNARAILFGTDHRKHR